MAMVTDENYLRENGLTDTLGIVLASTSKADLDDVPDYDDAFPQLTSTGPFDLNRPNTFFSASAFNGTSAMANNTTSSLHPSPKFDEDRRRKLAIHERSATTKIVCLNRVYSLAYSHIHSRLKFHRMIESLKVLVVMEINSLAIQVLRIPMDHPCKRSAHVFKRKQRRISRFSTRIKH